MVLLIFSLQVRHSINLCRCDNTGYGISDDMFFIGDFYRICFTSIFNEPLYSYSGSNDLKFSICCLIYYISFA